MDKSGDKCERIFRDFNRINVEKLQLTAMSLNWNDIYSMTNIDEQVDHVTNLIVKLMNDFAPERSVEPFCSSQPPWFRRELENIINQRDFFYSAAKSETNSLCKENLLKTYKRLRNKATTSQEAVNIDTHFYADDTQMYCSAPKDNIVACAEKINVNLALVMKWAVENEVEINPLKSKAIVISRNKITDPPPPLFIGTNVIEYCDETISLGLLLDSQMSWESHVNKVCCETYRGLAMLRQSAEFTPKETRNRLVQALLIPKFLYCSNIFMGCSRSSWNKIKLAFNACIRYIFNRRKFESISSFKDSLLGCSIEGFMHYRSCIFLFNLLRDKTPEYLYEKLSFPRFPRYNMLNRPTSLRTIQLNTSFFAFGVHLWNSLSPNLRSIKSATVFRQKCLLHFASRVT